MDTGERNECQGRGDDEEEREMGRERTAGKRLNSQEFVATVQCTIP